MNTEIFADYCTFLDREDKTLNGVSQTFADNNPEWKEERGNEGCWNCSRCSGCSDCSRCSRCSGCSDCSRCSRCSGCSDCSDCSGCSDCSRCSRCSGCSDCSDCSGCSDCSRCSRCSDCSDCSDCSRCSDCSDCSRCSGLKNAKPSESAMPEAPSIPNIHTRLKEAVTAPQNSLDMDDWHICSTTHCRAGWVVTIAGEKGKKLEEATSTEFAAMQIYKASSPIRVSPVRFYETNEVAMKDILRCAEEEAVNQQ